MTDAPKTIEGERIDYTAEELQAMGEAYAAAYADAMAERAVSDAEMVERVASDEAFLQAIVEHASAVLHGRYFDAGERRRAIARAAIRAMRGEP